MTPVALPQAGEKTGERTARPARVILYNDDWHTFDEVIGQLTKATGCGRARAEQHAWTVHTEGRDVVFEGPRPECEKAAGILRQIRLQTEVDFDAPA